MTTLALVTDAWHPQVNGVVRTLDKTREELTRLGINVAMITPEPYKTIPLPTYREIRLTIARPSTIHRAISDAAPDYVHIATEGPLGMMARTWCRRNKINYTTSYHTRFPEYVRARVPVPLPWTYAMVRRFHNGGVGCMISNNTLGKELSDWGFKRLVRWVRGVDTELFNPDVPPAYTDLPRPIFLYVGRVSVEKNMEAFLDLDLPGTKVVVGDGPALGTLKAKYKDAVFMGAKTGEALTAQYTAADVFVFPSLTDTWGLVQMEALACGVPVAAFPIMGPIDVIGDSGSGVLSWDLKEACLAALDIPRDKCRSYAEQFSWEASVQQFWANLQDANSRYSTAT
ncbi:glycosyltransferase family 1 protein [Acuticoccus sp. MNP-M23]|uniref:glycosyltransferase family 4 protein n=1 Tax=Acuticoccus sp. MNP-M23 TaxID=3072793 RepID=UPI00281513CF|nr:glycosyltransferase family 1 protein [Acuticoccus sp. MNP-M23]WMS41146.1 glycosyltransferase family 1 protein [Acuticoccus sp. MNP-M23]